MTVINPFDFFLDPDAERYPFRYDPALARDLAPYLASGEPGRLQREWLAEVGVPAGGEATVDFLVGLNRRVRPAVAYTTRFEPGVQTAEETLEKGVGSCRDSAWLLVQILRCWAWPPASCRATSFSSRPTRSPRRPARTVRRLHRPARLERGVRSRGGLDRPRPDLGSFRRRGSHPAGVHSRSGQRRPGHRRGRTVRGDLRVRQRGAPDPRGPAGHLALHRGPVGKHRRPGPVGRRAAGGGRRAPHPRRRAHLRVGRRHGGPRMEHGGRRHPKAGLARALTRRLAARFAPGGIVHHGQGKWYPGEALPRWQMAVVWRTDGVPLWADPTLLAEPWERTGDRGGRGAPGAGDRRPTGDPCRLLRPRLRGRHAPIVDRGPTAGRRGAHGRRRPDGSRAGGVGGQTPRRGRPGRRAGRPGRVGPPAAPHPPGRGRLGHDPMDAATRQVAARAR